MRKAIWVIILLCVIALIAVIGILSNNSGPRISETQQEAEVIKILNKIESYDLDNNYPDNPSDIISINNDIALYLYGGGASKDNISKVIKIQRKLFSAELLAINPEEQQIISVEQEVERFKENGYKLIKNKSFSPDYYESNIDNCSVKVIQYTNAKENNYLYYYLAKDDYELWRIMGWELSNKTFNEAGAIGG